MQAFLVSVSSIVEIVLVIILGYWLKSSNKIHDSFKGDISFLIMNVALPLSIFISVLDNLTIKKIASLSSGLLYVLCSFVLSYLAAIILVKVCHVRQGRRGTFINMIANANTIFIGLPLNVALFGKVSMPYFLIYYVANTISTWAVGVFFFAADDPTKKDQQQKTFDWKKLLPAPLIGFIISILWLITGFQLPNLLSTTFSMVGGLVTPLSLIYIGIVLAEAGLKSIKFDKDTVIALIGRFIIVPAIMIATILVFSKFEFNIPEMESSTLIVQSAISGLAVLPILAGQYHGDVKYATNVVTTSTLLFIVVIPVIMQIIRFI